MSIKHPGRRDCLDNYFSIDTLKTRLLDCYICIVKYKSNLSKEERLLDQYLGFIKTISTRFWSDQHIKLFPFPVRGGSIENISVINNQVLGKRAEAFFAAMISNSQGYRLRASQIQLIHNGITEGEIDFVVEQNATNKLFHVELAYKFYLLDKAISDHQAKWVGPNRRDSLKRKWTKLKEGQFSKLYSPTAGKVLNERGFENVTFQQSLCMPMQLFIPFGESKSSMGKLLSCFSGRWISFSEFTRRKWNDFAFFIPEKEDWFVNPAKCEIWMSIADIMPLLSEKIESFRSPMIWVKPKDGLPERMFITFW